MVSIAPSTPPRSLIASNSLYTASSTMSVSLSMMKLPCQGFSQKFKPSSRLMMSWIATARRTDSSVGVESVRIGIRVQRIAVVEQRVQRLQRGADVVELDFLRVQRATGGLDVVLHHL